MKGNIIINQVSWMKNKKQPHFGGNCSPSFVLIIAGFFYASFWADPFENYGFALTRLYIE